MPFCYFGLRRRKAWTYLIIPSLVKVGPAKTVAWRHRIDLCVPISPPYFYCCSYQAHGPRLHANHLKGAELGRLRVLAVFWACLQCSGISRAQWKKVRQPPESGSLCLPWKAPGRLEKDTAALWDVVFLHTMGLLLSRSLLRQRTHKLCNQRDLVWSGASPLELTHSWLLPSLENQRSYYLSWPSYVDSVVCIWFRR